MSPRRIAELDERERRWLIIRTILRASAIALIVVCAYFTLPVKEQSGSGTLLRLAVGLLVFAGVIAWQLRRIIVAEIPELRAVEALATVIPVFLILFATTYLSLSEREPAAFSEPLSPMGALYFSITIFSTVGFGDITPKSDIARLLVSGQMIGDLIAMGVILRLLVGAARAGLHRSVPPDYGE